MTMIPIVLVNKHLTFIGQCLEGVVPDLVVKEKDNAIHASSSYCRLSSGGVGGLDVTIAKRMV